MFLWCCLASVPHKYVNLILWVMHQCPNFWVFMLWIRLQTICFISLILLSSISELFATQFLFFFMHLICKCEPHFVIKLSFVVVKKTPKMWEFSICYGSKVKIQPQCKVKYSAMLYPSCWLDHWNQYRNSGLFMIDGRRYLYSIFRHIIPSILMNALWFLSGSTSGGKLPLLWAEFWLFLSHLSFFCRWKIYISSFCWEWVKFFLFLSWALVIISGSANKPSFYFLLKCCVLENCWVGKC